MFHLLLSCLSLLFYSSIWIFCSSKKSQKGAAPQSPAPTSGSKGMKTPNSDGSKSKRPTVIAVESTDKINPENPETLDPVAPENDSLYGLKSHVLFPDKDKRKSQLSARKKEIQPSSGKKDK